MSILNPTLEQIVLWLAQVGSSDSTLVSKLAQSNIKQAFVQKDETGNTLALEVIRLRAENTKLRDYQATVINAAIPAGYACVPETVLAPLMPEQPTATLVPCRLVPGDAKRAFDAAKGRGE